jgi:phosphatidate cytidylyltransferase
MSADLRARIVAGVPLAIFALFVVIMGGWWFTAGAIALGILCLGELFDMFRDVKPARLAGFLGLIALCLCAKLGGEDQVLLAAVCLFPVLYLLTVGSRSSEGGTFGLSIVTLGVFWIGLAIAHAIMLRELPHGGGIVGDVLIGTFVGDSGAYFGGRALGRRKLAPRVSPNKTVEGLVIGVFTAILAVWAAGLYQDWLSGTEAILLGLGVGLAAPIGDLFESFIKRDVGVKDTSRVFGAHGGALDRLDAILFTLVVGFYIWQTML